MTEPTVGVTVSGGHIQGIAGAGSVVIENFTIYNRAAEEPAAAVADTEPIAPCPYPGLAYFGPDDADRFFGRDAAITRLAEAIGRQSFTALVGASGSGKSSVVLAGLAPRLHGDRAGNWRFSHFRIGTELESNPFLALARAVAPLFVASDSDVERLRNTKLLATSLAAGELTLRDVFADCRSRNKGRRILLIADQFEEAFTLVADNAVRNRFIGVLLAGFPDPATGNVPDICLILTMRADFYGSALRHRPLADALQNHVENLGPMNREELQTAIVNPAQRAGVAFEPGMVETLLDAVQSKPGGLPLLQFALREVWGRQQRKTITRKSYDEIGGVEGALAQRAGTIYDALTANGKDMHAAMLFRRLFMRLVTFGEGAEDTRRIVGRAELDQEEWSLAQRLANEDNRLIVTGALAPGHETAEFVHEALIRNWPVLVEWVNRDREFRSWLLQLRPRVEEWRKSPADEGTLLRGGPLVVAEDWLARRPDEFNDEERTFVTESKAFVQRSIAADRAQKQRQLQLQRRVSLGAMAAALLLAIFAGIASVFGVFAYRSGQQADAQRARAENALEKATETANTLVTDLAEKFGARPGMPIEIVRDVLDRARNLQDQLINSGETAPQLRFSAAKALDRLVLTLLMQGDMKAGADIAAARRAADRFAEIMATLVKANPDNTQWQYELSLSQHRIGDVLMLAGDYGDALDAFNSSLAIRQELAMIEPGSPQWKDALATSRAKIGDALLKLDRRDEALDAYSEGLRLRRELTDIDRSNLSWQRELAVAYERNGVALASLGELDEAMAAFVKSLQIRQQLASDHANVQFSRDLAISHDWIGDVLLNTGKRAEALVEYQASFAVREKLAADNPGNTQFQRDLAVSYGRLGEVLTATGHRNEGLDSLRKSLQIREQLGSADPGNALWQADLVISLRRLAQAGDDPAARLSRALEIAGRLDREGKLGADQKGWVAELQKEVGEARK